MTPHIDIRRRQPHSKGGRETGANTTAHLNTSASTHRVATNLGRPAAASNEHE